MADFISLKINGLQETVEALKSKEVASGVKNGLRKVGDRIKSLSSQVIRDEYNLKRGDVDATFKVSAIEAAVLIRCLSRPINLTLFGAKQIGKAGGKRVITRRNKGEVKRRTRGKAGAFGGVAVMIKRGKTTLMPGAFIAKVEAGGGFNIGVFSETSRPSQCHYVDKRNRRKTSRPYVKSRRPLTPKARKVIINRAFVSVSSLFTGKRVLPVVENYLETDALKTIEHEIDWALGKRK